MKVSESEDRFYRTMGCWLWAVPLGAFIHYRQWAVAAAYAFASLMIELRDIGWRVDRIFGSKDKQ